MAIVAGGCTTGDETRAGAASRYLYVWSADDDGNEDDFLATIDADPSSPSYGAVVATTRVGFKNTIPHHTEYETPLEKKLLANGWIGARSYLFDFADPAQPKLSTTFRDVGDLSYPHSFLRLPDGRIVATFQGRGGEYGAPGGIAEISEDGAPIRIVHAEAEGRDPKLAWPYSLGYAPKENRIVVSMTEMGISPTQSYADTSSVQVYDAASLERIAEIDLPPSGTGVHHQYPAEPRADANGVMFVNTFNCGLHRIDDLGASAPKAVFVHAFPSKGPEEMCAVPVIVGKFWVQTVSAINGLIVLDISDPQKPVEVSRLSFDHKFHMPHWLAAERGGDRLVVTGSEQSWVLVVRLDPATGALSLDERFRDAGAEGPGVDFARGQFPHGASGKARVHGALFSAE
jgi:hypothetical protein